MYEVSLNDSKFGLSGLLIFKGCNNNCKYCFQSAEIRNDLNITFPQLQCTKKEHLFNIIEIYQKGIKNVVFGGADVTCCNNGEILRFDNELCKVLGLKTTVQINISSLSKINHTDFDEVYVSVNYARLSDWDYLIQNINRKTFTTCVVYHSDLEEIKHSHIIDRVILNVNERYLYEEAKEYTKQHSIPYLLSSVRGLERVK